jgi:hypothetical protein
MSINSLFFAAFLSQILLISFYFPRRILNRERFVFENFPPSRYPKLYPKSIADYKADSRKISYLFNAILVMGLMLWAVMLRYAPINLWDDLATWYFIIQLSPVMYLEFSAMKTFKLMRNRSGRSTRSAELQPRHLFDFVSPLLVGTAVLLYLALMLFILFMTQNDLYVGNSANTKMISVTVSYLLLLGIIFWILYGKKQNPHQSHTDRLNQMELVIKQLILISIAASAYMAFDTVMDYLSLSELIPFFDCLFLQLLAFISLWGLNSIKIGEMNFEVYKEDSLSVESQTQT